MKAWKTFVLAIFAVSLFGMSSTYGEEIGELDTTFGEDGKVITSFDEFGDQAYAVALQADGKILAAGSASNGDDLDIAIARYNKDGSLDTSFSREGKLRTSLGDGDEELTAIAVQDDGYIVAAGYTVVDGGRSFVLVRFTPEGEFDNSFGEGGMVVTEFGNQDDEITGMTIDDEGRIVVCGYVTGTAGVVVAVARYEESGAPDVTFGDEGSTLTDIGDDALARSVGIDKEGRIVITGSYFHADRTELMVLRFFENGDLDKGFGQGGIAVPANPELASEGFGVGLLEDGRILVAGTVGTPGDLDSAVYRFDESGQPDSSFGDNGVLFTSASDEDDMALAIDVLDNVVGLSGFSTFNTKRDFLFVSVEDNSDEGTNIALNSKTGSFLSSERKYNGIFDLNGQQVESTEDETTEKSVFSTTPFGYTDDVSFAVVLQPDGKAISVGYTEQDGISSFAVARYVTPVANAAVAGLDTSVDWIWTKEPTEVNRTGGFTGGTILDTGLSISQRGVVFSIAPDPVYEEGEDSDDSGGSGGGGGGGGGDVVAPIITIVNPEANDEINTTDFELRVTTDETCNCRYADSDVVYEAMTTFPQTSSKSFVETVPVTDTNAYWVRCRDVADNESKKSVTYTKASGRTNSYYSHSVDTSTVVVVSDPVEPSETVNAYQVEDTPAELLVSNGSPYGEIAAGSSMTYIGVYTNERAICKFTDLSGLDYASMSEAMATADNLSHIAKVDGLQDDNAYSFYIRCRDFAGNENVAEYEIFFSVASNEDDKMQPYRQLTKTLRDFILPNAHAQTTTTTTASGATTATTGTESNSPKSAFDLSTPNYLLEGHTDNGAGEGSYSSILKDLKPGTFYYVRAYAIDSSGKVYYGNQVGLKTADSCFIATAAYGTIVHPYVKVLRNFRDQYMVTNVAGRSLVNLYYHYSPPVADYISERPVVRGAVGVALLPVVGMGWLILNVGFAGMFLAALFLIMPSMLIYRSYRRLEVY